MTPNIRAIAAHIVAANLPPRAAATQSAAHVLGYPRLTAHQTRRVCTLALCYARLRYGGTQQ